MRREQPPLFAHIVSNEIKHPLLGLVSAKLGAQVYRKATDPCPEHSDNYPEIILFVFPFCEETAKNYMKHSPASL